MNIQIIGTRKCQTTRRAERFFKERGLAFTKLDLLEKALSPGEIRNILAVLSEEELLNREARIYKTKFAYLDFDLAQELEENPRLLKTPVVRQGRKATVGYQPDVWKAWIEE